MEHVVPVDVGLVLLVLELEGGGAGIPCTCSLGSAISYIIFGLPYVLF